jgi:hypothetical protein
MFFPPGVLNEWDPSTVASPVDRKPQTCEIFFALFLCAVVQNNYHLYCCNHFLAIMIVGYAPAKTVALRDKMVLR